MILLIYTPKITNRIRFIFNLIFRDLLHIQFNITNKTSEFRSFQGPKINYSLNAIGDELFFFAHHLLLETGIKQQEINFISFEGIKCPFAVFKNSLMPFDPFAASFYLSTRYFVVFGCYSISAS